MRRDEVGGSEGCGWRRRSLESSVFRAVPAADGACWVLRGRGRVGGAAGQPARGARGDAAGSVTRGGGGMSGARRARALPPVDSMRLVRNFPACEATDTETKLASLRPAGAPMVIHLFTGCAAGRPPRRARGRGARGSRARRRRLTRRPPPRAPRQQLRRVLALCQHNGRVGGPRREVRRRRRLRVHQLRGPRARRGLRERAAAAPHQRHVDRRRGAHARVGPVGVRWRPPARPPGGPARGSGD